MPRIKSVSRYHLSFADPKDLPLDAVFEGAEPACDPRKFRLLILCRPQTDVAAVLHLSTLPCTNGRADALIRISWQQAILGIANAEKI